MATDRTREARYGLTLRRLRQDRHIRELTREVRVSASQLIQPHFVVEGLRGREAVPGLPGVHRDTPDSLLKQVDQDLEAGTDKLLLFGVPGDKRDTDIRFDFTARQIEALRKRFGADLWIAVDVCLCSFTTHGHCGVLNREQDHVINDASVEQLARASLEYAQAGANCVAPSDMMDGRVAAIRQALDGGGCERTLLMSYSAKFHSRFYGPFREAADSAPRAALKDRASYQIDPARADDAYLSSQRDADEGADILMVKPGLPYLDILKDLSARIPRPWAVYEVSGEYGAFEALASQQLMDGAQRSHRMLDGVRARRRLDDHHLWRSPRAPLVVWRMKSERSAALFERARRVTPGGVHSPVRAFRGVGGVPRFIREATGSRLIDVDGNIYIDFCMSWGPLIFGHQDPHVRAAVEGALSRGWSYGAAEAGSLELAEWICRRIPWVEQIRFVNSGTEAVMSALRLARAATGRPRILKFHGCYHGHVDSMLVKAGSGLAEASSPDSAGVSEETAANTLVVPLDDSSRVARGVRAARPKHCRGDHRAPSRELWIAATAPRVSARAGTTRAHEWRAGDFR